MTNPRTVTGAHRFPFFQSTTMAHHPYCSDFRDMDPGFAAATGDEFIAEYGFEFPTIYKHCLGCCLAYLTIDRNYTRVNTKSGLFYVHFPFGNPPDRYRTPSVDGFAWAPRGKKGQIATGHDHNLGEPFRRTFQASRTYQLYVPNYNLERGLSIGFPCYARMESVAIDGVDQVNDRDIADIKLNFANAALVERYKEMFSKTPPFRGYCMTPPLPDQVGPLVKGMRGAAIN